MPGSAATQVCSVDEAAVDFITDDYEVVLYGQPGDLLQLVALDDGAGGVVRVAQQNDLGARRNGLRNRLGLDLEAVLDVCPHGHNHAARQHDIGLVSNVAGVGHDHFVAGIEQCAQRRINTLADAHGDHDLGARVILKPVAPLEVGRDGLTQLQCAVVGGVVGLTLLDGLDARLANVVRSDEIRLADAEGDDVLHGSRDVEEPADARWLDSSHALREHFAPDQTLHCLFLLADPAPLPGK
jgi:hypothetical protein